MPELSGELESNLTAKGLRDDYAQDIALWWRVLTQQKNDKDKVYSLHEPEVLCISKGKEHDLFCKRAGIEPVIGHLKSDHRLGRNFYKGVFGDEVNIMYAAAAYNFKRAMRLLLRLISGWIARIQDGINALYGNKSPRI